MKTYVIVANTSLPSALTRTLANLDILFDMVYMHTQSLPSYSKTINVDANTIK